MYAMCHVLSGVMLGSYIAARTGERSAIHAGIAGSILPDLVDKPLGLVLAGTVGYGRTYSHTLLAVFILSCVYACSRALAPRSSRMPTLILATVTGVLVHQVLDAMWRLPAAWFWPLLGGFPAGEVIPLIPYILADILQPAEWIAGIASIVILSGVTGTPRFVIIVPRGTTLFCGIASLWILMDIACGSASPLTGWDSLADNMIVAVVLFSGAFFLERARSGGFTLADGEGRCGT